MPVGRPSDAEPVNLAVGVDVGDPGDVLIVGVPVLDQGVLTRHAKDAAKSRECVRTEILVAEDQDRVVRESLMDPGDGGRVERCGEVDTTSLGAERLPEGRRVGVGDICVLPLVLGQYAHGLPRITTTGTHRRPAGGQFQVPLPGGVGLTRGRTRSCR